MTSHLSQRELESYLWGAATLLRGLVDASDYKQYIFPLMFFKRLSDVWEEDYQDALDDTGDEGYATATANASFTFFSAGQQHILLGSFTCLCFLPSSRRHRNIWKSCRKVIGRFTLSRGESSFHECV